MRLLLYWAAFLLLRLLLSCAYQHAGRVRVHRPEIHDTQCNKDFYSASSKSIAICNTVVMGLLIPPPAKSWQVEGYWFLGQRLRDEQLRTAAARLKIMRKYTSDVILLIHCAFFYIGVMAAYGMRRVMLFADKAQKSACKRFLLRVPSRRKGPRNHFDYFRTVAINWERTVYLITWLALILAEFTTLCSEATTPQAES